VFQGGQFRRQRGNGRTGTRRSRWLIMYLPVVSADYRCGPIESRVMMAEGGGRRRIDDTQNGVFFDIAGGGGG